NFCRKARSSLYLRNRHEPLQQLFQFTSSNGWDSPSKREDNTENIPQQTRHHFPLFSFHYLYETLLPASHRSSSPGSAAVMTLIRTRCVRPSLPLTGASRARPPRLAFRSQEALEGSRPVGMPPRQRRPVLDDVERAPHPLLIDRARRLVMLAPEIKVASGEAF